MTKLSAAIKQAIIQMAGTGTPLERIIEVLESKGIKVDLEDVVRIIRESEKEAEDVVNVDDISGVMRWLINNQVKRVSRLLAVEMSSTLPLPETTNNIKILAELLVKYSEMSKGQVGIKKLKESIFGVFGDENESE